jgi:hypothetical protein
MAAIAQDLLVALIVAGCAIFSAWRLMSPRVRLRTLEWLAPAATRLGASAVLARLRNQTMGQLAAGCSACSHNKTAVHHPGGRRA